MRKEVRKQLIFRGVMTGMLHHSLSMESQCLLTAGQNNIRMLQLIQRILNGEVYRDSISVKFRLKKYYGVSVHEALTDEEILALTSSWAERPLKTTVFDCSGGKYPYYILPASMISDIQFWIGGLRNSDWVKEVRTVTNVYGYTESYTIFRLNSIQTDVLNIEVK